MKKILFTIFLCMAAIITYAQEDTLHISTDKRDGIVYSRYYVINDSQFMIVHYKAEKNDTIYEETIPEYYQDFYKREVYLRDLKRKDVSKVVADEVFDYFKGLTEEELLTKLSNKRSLSIWKAATKQCFSMINLRRMRCSPLRFGMVK